jgi:type II secretory pathway component PulF
MPRFSYSARSQAGEKVDGVLESNDRRAALMQIERMGLVPVSVKEAAAGAALPAKSSAKPETKAAAKAPSRPKGKEEKPARFQMNLGGPRAPRMNMRETLFFARELSDLLSSGMTLGNALHTLARRKTKSDQDRIVVELRDEIIKGSSLSEALTRYPDTFSNLFVSMVRAGEASGAVNEALGRLVKHYERVLEAREKIVGAMIYPAIVLIVGVLTIVFTMTFVIPKFSVVFAELGATLPLPTRILIGMSNFMIAWGWLLALVVAGGVVFIKRYIRTDAGERRWHGLMLRLPVIKKIVTANAFSQFARTLGALLTNGVPVLQALSIVENTVGNRLIAEEIHNARERVTDGSTISGPLAAGKVFPELLTDMLAVGEEAGDMSGSLAHIAQRYESDLDRSIKLMTTVLEPAMILGIALGVGFVAMSMLMAVFSLTSGLNV